MYSDLYSDALAQSTDEAGSSSFMVIGIAAGAAVLLGGVGGFFYMKSKRSKPNTTPTIVTGTSTPVSSADKGGTEFTDIASVSADGKV